MKNTPRLLAFFLILITFFRVSGFLANGIRLGVLGYAFAVAVTAGVFVSGYFTGFRETKIWAIILLIAFGITDLYFNELEMVRTLAPETLIGNGSNFLGVTSDGLTRMMHIAAVAYGSLPTLLAGGLGILQGNAEKVATLNKPVWIATAVKAIAATFTKGIKANLEEHYHISKYSALQSGNSGKSLTVSDDTVIDADALNGKVRWEDLLAVDKTAIAGMSTRQIVAKWHVSERSARNWKSRVEAGE